MEHLPYKQGVAGSNPASPTIRPEILREYPYLEKDDIQAALAYAAWRSDENELPLKAS